MDAIEAIRAGEAWREVIEGPGGERVRAMTRRTPLLPAGDRLLVKAEGLQRTGSYKVRGAIARVASLPADAEVVAASAGNHGLGVAFAAGRLGIRATVVVPETSPQVKRRGIEGLGARLLVHGAAYDDAEARARALAAERGATFVSGFQDERVLLGNGGTVALELREQAGGVGAGDVVVIPVGGGGLASGIGAILAGTGATLLGVEPEANHAMRDSFAAGAARTSYPEGGETIAEGLEGAVSERTYELCRAALAEIALVSEEAIRRAIAHAYRELALVLEPSAAVSLAAVRRGTIDADGRRVICVATGSNIDPDLLDACLRG